MPIRTVLGMTNSTATPSRTATSARPLRRIAALGLAIVAGLIVWAVAVPVAGVALVAGQGPTAQTVGPVPIVIALLVMGLLGWGVSALLARFAPRARPVWFVVAGLVLALSLAGPLTMAVGAAAAVLVVLHLVPGLILVLGLAPTRR